MSAYERVVDGEVVEGVITVDNTHEDNRIGALVLEGKNGWRIAVPKPPEDTEQATPDLPAPQITRTRKRAP